VKPDWLYRGELGAANFGDFIERVKPLIGRESGGAILGVGVLFFEAPLPLVLVDVAQEPEYAEIVRPPLIPVSGLRGEIEALITSLEPPPDTTAMIVSPPEPVGGPPNLSWQAGVVIESRTRGTLGPCVMTSAGEIYLTAGHVAGPPSSPVHLVETRFLLPDQRKPLGSILMRSVPVAGGPAEYDVASIAVDLESRSGPCEVARVEPFQHTPLPVTLTGAISGRGFGEVIGALDTYTDAVGERRWKNSWIMTPGAIGAEGDSGGSVTLNDDSVLGILVHGTKVANVGRFGSLFVQDLESIEIELL